MAVADPLPGDCHGHASSMRVLLGLWFTAAVDISSDLLSESG